MASFGIDGLVSGLDTTSLINQLMQIEAAPQTLLKSKQATAQDVGTALKGINARLLSLSTAAESAAKADNWKAFTATASSDAATATTTTAAQAGTVSFSVDTVANRQVSLSAAVTSGPQLTADNPPTLTLKKADGSLVSVTAASNSLSDMAKAINDSAMGITATAVRVAGGATPTYRLQFTAGTTGTDGAFELYVGNQAAVNAATAPRLDTAMVTTAVDAQITLWKGTAEEQVFSQSSNTFSDLMTGVNVTVAKATDPGKTVTIDVKADAATVSGLAKSLVGALTLVLSDIDSRTKTTVSTNSDGTTKVVGGLLTGDVSTMQLRSQIVNSAAYPVGNTSPSSVGIVLEKNGSITFDADKFAKALEADPDGTAAYVQELATRVQTLADGLSDPYDGSLTARVKSQESLVANYTKQIENWDVRLEMRRSTLETTYSNLEVTLSKLNSQSSWLSSQLASLSASTSA